MSSTDCPCMTCPQEINIVYGAEFQDYIQFHATNYQELRPNIRINLQPIDGSFTEIQELLLDDPKSWDGAMFPSQLAGSLVGGEALWDLTDYVKTSEVADWSEMLPFFRHQVGEFDEQTRLIPLDGDVLSMFYRKDLFQEYNMTVPRTWDEYTEAAEFFHGQPLGPGGTELYGSCVTRIDKCGNEYWTSLVLSSLTQSDGTSTGFFLDPITLEPLFGAAMNETLKHLGNQFKFGHEDELTDNCLTPNFDIHEGKCAMTYGWGNLIGSPGGFYDIAAAPTPGSNKVLDRSSGRLVDCTVATCPHGVFYDGLGIVNHSPYSAFGGWASGISDHSPDSQKYAAADFFGYVSNSNQSIADVLPNSRSGFAQPYRYSHVSSNNWINEGFDNTLATSFTESIRAVYSENSVLELRIPPASSMRRAVDEELFDYYSAMKENPSWSPEQETILRDIVTLRLEERIREIVSAEDQESLRLTYQQSLGYERVRPADSMNFINENFRDAAWGVAGLICVMALSIFVWTLRYRNNRVMKAFQPFLLMQTALGLFLMGGTIIPLGFDDSLFSPEVLNYSCMAVPWMYVFGFTIFFSSVYSKIRACMKIYKEPHKFDVLVVEPGASVRLNLRLLFMNGVILTIWTVTDPLRWVRDEVEGGIVFPDGTVETFGACRGKGVTSLGFPLCLYILNLLMCVAATIQAFRCRFLVLEYNEMQWLPLAVFPFAEVWFVGGPIVWIVKDDPTTIFVVLAMIIIAGAVVSAMATFAPKDWFIRREKFVSLAAKESKMKAFPERKSSAGILVLKHPTVESQKQVERLESQTRQMHALNTELEIEIRAMKDKFKEFTESERFAVRESLFTSMAGTVDSPEYTSRGVEEFEQTEISRSNDVELEAMNLFQQVWKMPDDDYEEDHEVSPVPIPSSPISKSRKVGEHAQQLASTPSASQGKLPDTPESNHAPVFEDPDLSGPTAKSHRSPVFPSSPGSSGSSDRVADGDRFEDEDADDQDYPVTANAYKTLLNYSSNQQEPSFDQSSISDHNSEVSDLQQSENDPVVPDSRPLLKDAPKGMSVFGFEDEEWDEPENATRSAGPSHALLQHRHTSNIEIPSDNSGGFGNDDSDRNFANQSHFDEESSSDEESDTMIRKKDFKDLSTMIETEDLDALTAKAASVADSLKTKLNDSNLADLSHANDADTTATSAMMPLNLYGLGDNSVNGGVQSRDSSYQEGLSGLDISKIGSEDGDREFVDLSDSILDSPKRNGVKKNNDPLGLGLAATAGESSGKAIPNGDGSNTFMSNVKEIEEAYTRQHAGEPSQGDLRYKAESAKAGTAFDPNLKYNQSPQVDKNTVSKLNEIASPAEAEPTNTSYSISDWSAVGVTASVLADWSDSQSTGSYADSVSSMDATTKASALKTPLAKEIDNLVARLDFDGVTAASQKYETKASTPTKNGGLSKIAEKKRKKRELEDWRASISKTFTKS